MKMHFYIINLKCKFIKKNIFNIRKNQKKIRIIILIKTLMILLQKLI